MTRRVCKAVIPAAGLGTRFLPATKAQPKEMLPLVDTPTIQYVVEEAVAAGIQDILIITGRSKRAIEDHFDRSFELEYELERAGKHDELKLMREIADMATIHYVRQGEPKGLGHAVGIAREHVGDEPFAVLLGDDVMVDESRVLCDMLALYEQHGRSVIAVKEVEPADVSAYGCVKPSPAADDGDGLLRIVDIVEKPAPEDAPSNLAVMGRYVFTPEIFDAIDLLQPGRGGELQLTDAIGLLIEEQDVYGHVFTEGRFDMGNKMDFIRATVSLALERDDLGPPLRAFLRGLADEGRLDP
ncbi:MAG TPA: UTP--glucose-1-phosphate uridylyltransferase GalU [Acidimicrobiales bacterium]|nr:UTP--glucose-1-phosphate uridylyltransferase GalU [Acidimicrobiales bacterium]